MKFKNSFYLITTLFLVFIMAAGFIRLKTNNISVNKNLRDSKDTLWIFNGKDLSNLKVILENPEEDIKDVYSIKGNAIYFKKEYKGFIRTKEDYSNFHFHAEWMWPEKDEKGNSGILLFIQQPDTIWPNCIQINFKEHHAGDLIAMSGAKFKEAEGKPKTTAIMLKESSEKPEGEWNNCEIVCAGDSLSAYVNDVLQNKATGIVNHNGPIGWQLEGKAVALRNVYLIRK